MGAMLMSTILVNLADRRWTLAAVKRACELAAEQGLTVTLLHLIPVQHLSWLGTEFGLRSMTNQEHEIVEECAYIAEDYGVSLVLQPMQYATFAHALVEAAEILNAQMIFATAPQGLFQPFREWQLKRTLAAHGLPWVSVEPPRESISWTVVPVQ
jgi:sugar phosphate isomerase/epimerase